MPRAILQQKQPYKIEVTVEGSKVDRTALEAEKKRLMTRIAEIDALLAECETVCDQSQEIGTQSGYEHVEPKHRAMPQEVKDFKNGKTAEYTITPPTLNADNIDNAVPEELRNEA